jgi:Asp-tRNA(Asn)/Glu-tRNA(Gln) amidotransferase B subunit
MGMVGVLPVLNRHPAELAIRAGFAAHCEIAHESTFARKNYFYPGAPRAIRLVSMNCRCVKGLCRSARMSDRDAAPVLPMPYQFSACHPPIIA